jgi:hypothetical protein
MNARLKVILGTLLLDVTACARPAPEKNDAGRVDTQTSPAAQRDSQPSPTPTPPASQTPKIDRVVPDSARVGSAVDEVRIIGTGFEPGRSGQNTVDVGPIHLTMVPANDAGTEIRFTVPAEAGGSAQTRPRRVLPGTYDVTVTTRAGVSNAIPLRILP